MLAYAKCDQKFVEECRDLGWDNDMIHKYLTYRMKRTRVIERGRTAFKDSNQSKVYKSEFKYSQVYGYGKKFNTIKECEKYVKRVTKSLLWQQLTGGKTVTVGTMNSRRWAGLAYGSHINLSVGGFNEYVILHELAHCSGNMHHDVSFRRDLVKLVSRFLGREQAKTLKQCFLSDGLKMTIKSTVKSPSEWLASYNKMAAMRQKLPSAITNV